jgi:hypothetical protein
MEILSVGIPEHELRKPLAHLRELLEGVDLNITYAESLDVARGILKARADITLLFLGDGDRADYMQLLSFSAKEAKEIPAIIMAYETYHYSLTGCYFLRKNKTSTTTFSGFEEWTREKIDDVLRGEEYRTRPED